LDEEDENIRKLEEAEKLRTKFEEERYLE